MESLQGIKFPDYLVVAIYFVLVVFIGVYFSRKIKQAKDYFAAGNVMPWWLAGTSFYMASFSTLLFVIYNEIAYKYGIVAVIICWNVPVAVLLGGRLTAHLWRRARILTPVGFMERRFNKTVHQIFVWTGFPLRLFDNALKIYSTALVLMVAINSPGITFNRFVLFIGIVMIAFTYMGGQLAVMVTDFVQAIIIAVAVIVLFIMTYISVGGINGFMAGIPAGFFNPAPKPYDWTYLIFTVLALGLLTYNASWSLVQKYNCVKSEEDAGKMIYWIAFLTFIFPPLFFFPGMAASILLPGLENSRYAYAAICLKILPVGMMGFIIAAMLSATMSTLGSEYNTLSGVLTRDFYKRIINPGASEKREMLFGRFATLIIGVVTMLLAILLNSLKGLTLMDIMYRFFSAFGPPIMIPLIAGLLFKYFNSRGVIWGVISGAVTGAVLVAANVILVQKYSVQMAQDPQVDYWLRSGLNSAATMLNIAATTIGMFLGTIFYRTPEDEKKRVALFFEDLKRPFEIEEGGGGEKVSPFGLIGTTLFFLGLAIMAVAFVILGWYRDTNAFLINLAVAVFLMALGAVMKLSTRGKNA